MAVIGMDPYGIMCLPQKLSLGTAVNMALPQGPDPSMLPSRSTGVGYRRNDPHVYIEDISHIGALTTPPPRGGGENPQLNRPTRQGHLIS